jgi:hypothetical protein
MSSGLLKSLGIVDVPEAVWRVRGAGAYKPPAEESDDLARVLALPRRPRPTPEEAMALAAKWTGLLRHVSATCQCSALGRPCITDLRPIQGWALEEAARVGGEVGFIRIGAGKTALDIFLAMVVPNVKRAMLLIPASLRAQFYLDYAAWSQHFRTPNLAGGSGPFYGDRPVLQVMTYTELQTAKNRTALVSAAPDIFILDEFQNLKNRAAARTGRWLRYLEDNLGTRIFAHSGSPMTRSVLDYSHIAALSLRGGSPVPLDLPTMTEWASVLDPTPPGMMPAPVGALRALCEEGETARSGFRRRLLATPGIVATEDSRIVNRLVLRKRDPGPIPLNVRQAMTQVQGGTRPDGEEFREDVEIAACLNQLASGFFYKWYFPHGEPDALKDLWFLRRKEWFRELRQKLQYRVDHLDSPLLCEHAAARYFEGREPTLELPTWKSECYLPWIEVEDKVYHEQRPVWLSDWVAEDAAAWAKDGGIVWVDHVALGHRIERVSGIKYYGGGAESSAEIIKEKGDRPIVASIASHMLGKNLQAFSRNLIANPPADGETWEQVIGRTYREGQRAAEVTVDVYQHTEGLKNALRTATNLAKGVFETSGSVKALLYAERVDLPPVSE